MARHNKKQVAIERICVKLKQPPSQKVQVQLASIITFKIEKKSKFSLSRTSSIGKGGGGGGGQN